MKPFLKGEGVVIIGTVLHVRKDGSIDIKIGPDKVAFGVDPAQVCLIVDPEEEEHDVRHPFED